MFVADTECLYKALSDINTFLGEDEDSTCLDFSIFWCLWDMV